MAKRIEKGKEKERGRLPKEGKCRKKKREGERGRENKGNKREGQFLQSALSLEGRVYGCKNIKCAPSLIPSYHPISFSFLSPSVLSC